MAKRGSKAATWLKFYFRNIALSISVGAMIAASAADIKPDPEKGNEVFDEQCSSCHNAYSVDRKTGPGLKWLFVKDKLDSNGKAVNEGNVLEKINAGGKGMPAYKDTLSAEDKIHLIAYLKTL